MERNIKDMTRLSEKLDIIFRALVLVLFVLFVGYLALLSLYSTNYCFVGEPAIFVSDSPWKALLAYVVLVGALAALKTWGMGVWTWLSDHRRLMQMALNGLLFLFLLFFVLSNQLHPHGDQLAISNGAVGLRKYDFSLFANESYFVYWPFQSRITVFLWGFFAVFGNLNYLAFQTLNGICIVISLNLVAKSSAIIFGSRDRELPVFLACLLFWPYLFYVTFIYGNVPGFACIIGAVYLLLRYLEEGRIQFLAGCVILCAAGVWLKNTFLIFMVALLVFLLVDFWSSRRYRNLIGMVCILAAVSLLGKGSDLLVEHRLGFPLSEGSPMIAWVTMAFGEDEDGRPVKFDGYNREVYLEHDLDTDRAAQAAVEELKRRLAHLTDTPMHFMEFMGRKIAMEWNEPTFESLVANNRPQAQTEQPALIRWMLREDNRNVLVKWANLFHALVLMGAFSWALLQGRREKVTGLFFAVVFIGGFLFQLFWETYAQYTLFYFLLLIPYAVAGYLAAADRVLAWAGDRKPNRAEVAALAVSAGVTAAVGLLPFGIFQALFTLDEDDVSYTEARMEQDAEEARQEAALANGYYRLCPLLTTDRAVASLDTLDERGLPQAGLMPAAESSGDMVSVYHEYGYDFLRLKSTQYLLSFDGSPAEGEVRAGQDCENIMWKILPVSAEGETGDGDSLAQAGIPAGEKGYAITCDGGFALTARDGKITVEPYTGCGEQIWLFTEQ